MYSIIKLSELKALYWFGSMSDQYERMKMIEEAFCYDEF